MNQPFPFVKSFCLAKLKKASFQDKHYRKWSINSVKSHKDAACSQSTPDVNIQPSLTLTSVTHAQGLIQSPLKSTERTSCPSAGGKSADKSQNNVAADGTAQIPRPGRTSGDVLVYASLLRLWQRRFHRIYSLFCPTGNPTRKFGRWRKSFFQWRNLFCYVGDILPEIDAIHPAAQMK